MTEIESSVRRIKDDWLEVDAKAGEDMFVIDPIQIRPGNEDDSIRISNIPPIGAEVPIDDLRVAIERIERDF